MEASESIRRIVWRHRWLLLAMTCLPVLVLAPLLLTRPSAYSATTDVQSQGAVPSADTQVLGILGLVSSIATSDTVVHQALDAAGVDRDPVVVARRQVSTSAIGSSGLVAITVTDRSPDVAVRLSKALATAVVRAVNGLGVDAGSQLTALAQQQKQLTSTRDSLLQQLTQAQAGHRQATDAGVQALLAELNAVEAQLSNSISATQQLVASNGAEQSARVVSAPSVPALASRHVAAYSALAALLGLVVGLLLATTRELAWPTVAEPAAGARELGVVVLFDARLVGEGTEDVPDLATRLELAADRLGAGTLVLTGPMARPQLAVLASRIDGVLAARARDATIGAGRGSSVISTIGGACGPTSCARPGLRAVSLSDTNLRSLPRDPALVLVLPRFSPRTALDQAADLAVTTGWPILGVIGLRRSSRRLRRAWSRPTDASAVDDGVPSDQSHAPRADPVDAHPADDVPLLIADGRGPDGARASTGGLLRAGSTDQGGTRT